MEDFISEEMATNEMNKWLDHKNVSKRKRNKKETKQQIETLIDSVMDKEGKKVVIDKLTFKPRLLLEDVESHLMNVKSTNTIGMLAAYTAALTGKSSSVLKKIDTDDNKTAQAIVMFFL